MNTVENQEDLNKALLSACDVFSNEAEQLECRDYILTILFLKFVTDIWQAQYQNYQKTYGDNVAMVDETMNEECFVLPEKANFYSIQKMLNDRKEDVRCINTALCELEENNENKWYSSFNNISFDNNDLLTDQDKNEKLRCLINNFAKLSVSSESFLLGELNYIGDAYEFLIEHFAKLAEDKFNAFYTPQDVSELITELVGVQEGDEIYDPACRSASLLIKCGKQIEKSNRYYELNGQDADKRIAALARMNLFLHNMQSFQIGSGDSISHPCFIDSNDSVMKEFDVVVSNPPFLMEKWNYQIAENDKFGRFDCGVPPKTKGNYAFVQHMLKSLKAKSGRMAIVVPEGLLFRGAGEAVIRKNLIEDNLLETVISLPKKILYDTVNSAVIMIFKKNKIDHNILFIDASNDFSEGEKFNFLADEDIRKIVLTAKNRKNIRNYAYLATYEDIRKNEFNLNISRYVNASNEDEYIDIMLVRKEREIIKNKIAALEDEMDQCLIKLGLLPKDSR